MKQTTTIVGIDIASASFEAAFMDASDGALLRQQSYRNTQPAMRSSWKALAILPMLTS